MKNSKQKGNSWEREVSRIFDNIFDTTDAFWRTHNSGSLTKCGHSNNIFAGDIYATDPKLSWFNETFYVECKFLKELRLEFDCPQLLAIMEKAKVEANDKKIVLVVKRNFKSPVALFSYFVKDWDAILNVNDNCWYVKKLVKVKLSDFTGVIK
jgi:hypothetical protein